MARVSAESGSLGQSGAEVEDVKDEEGDDLPKEEKSRKGIELSSLSSSAEREMLSPEAAST